MFHVQTIATADEMERAYDIRYNVFSVEQGFDPSIDKDDTDAVSTHFLLYANKDATAAVENAIGVARLYEYHGDSDKTIKVGKIGRVAVLKSGRFGGAGTALMKGVEEEAKRQGFSMLKLHAQTQAERFYSVCGFVVEGDIFDEEGAPHVLMIKKL